MSEISAPNAIRIRHSDASVRMRTQSEELWNGLRSVSLMKPDQLLHFIQQRFPVCAEGSNHFGGEPRFVRLANSVIGITKQEQRIGIGRARFFEIRDRVLPTLLLVSEPTYPNERNGIGGIQPKCRTEGLLCSVDFPGSQLRHTQVSSDTRVVRR